MIIDSLSVLDFRVFSGAHNFDLVPKIKRGKNAPIVLFGGLNGGGKTTILSALKLALYGKGVLGSGATVAEYHQYLRECIHRAHNSIAKPTRSAVELTFRYAQYGVISSYQLTRDWFVDHAGKVKEGLIISRDGHPLTELSYDQAQAFLNELIPIGVSELFFFDGEKIASLAEETSGDALRESINKLLGLDLIDRLHSDLSVIIRGRSIKKASEDRKQKIAEAERTYNDLNEQLAEVREKLLLMRVNTVEANKNLGNIEASINARGGAWSASRQEETVNLDALVSDKKAIEHTLHDMLSGLLPFAITQSLNEKLLAQIDAEQRAEKAQVLSEYLQRQQSNFLAEVESAFAMTKDQLPALQDIFLRTFGSEVANSAEQEAPVHELSDTQRFSITHRLQNDVGSLQQRAADLVMTLQETDSQIESARENIARAPDEKVLIPLFNEQGQLQGRLSALEEQKSVMAEEAKALLARLSVAARQLDDLYTEIAESQEDERLTGLAQNAKDVLKEFSTRARIEKLKELESQFYTSFNGLARKEDRNLSIQIDPNTFEVVLIDDEGVILRKEELSAGEKQIFAISILEALARTSGRSLPVVIDTPLGRLDSVHRKKLVVNYFPKTSHQVIILSTDTEIDYAFYEGLQGSISHSYHLVYNPETRSTQAEEGYFWRWAQNA
ncbi:MULTISPECIES: DNA sulfur modification protein DndD [unclassified Pseudomonas]|uniref:DNA sulfur modification protein DndD n=1 Tax=unclassified Pseudomonas TaxID=196821 RepID=UPI000270269E|nr:MULTISPECIES: DNA sulfur modification protein DndD [unclassified Pseudomonas]EJM00838.1 DNA sulfur modification protein DndD [Pseudomonas sp. GM16]EJM45668.1 DNA sulfur modification protein DndD [Pseudomonas sp. GM24]